MTRKLISRPWTDEEQAYLRRMWASGLRLEQMARALRRSKSAIRGKAENLGLPKRTAANPRSASHGDIAAA
jgi:hypothetical protein